MKEYDFREQRTQFRTCPGCQADLELEVNQCRFCDCRIDFETPESDLESASSAKAQAVESSDSVYAMLAVNILVSIASFYVTSTDQLPESPARHYEFRLSEQDQNYAARLFDHKQVEVADQLHARSEEAVVTEPSRGRDDQRHRD